MASFSNLTIVGRLTRDPEKKNIGGNDVATLSVAVNGRKDKNGNQSVEYFDVNVWNGSADNCMKYLAKGREVCVNGSLSTRTYKDKNGENRTSLVVNAQNVVFLNAGSDNGGEKRSYNSAPKKQEYTPVEGYDDSLPF